MRYKETNLCFNNQHSFTEIFSLQHLGANTSVYYSIAAGY